MPPSPQAKTATSVSLDSHTTDPARDLMDVRAAYRVLEAYHQRLFNTLTLLRTRLSERFGTLEHVWWDVWDPIREDADPLVREARCVEVLSRACLLWVSGRTAAPGSYKVYVEHLGDAEPDGTSLDPARRRPLDVARTTLAVWFYAVASPPDGKPFEHWDDYSVDDDAHPGWKDGKCHSASCHGAEIRFGGLVRDMADLATREAIEENLVGPVSALLDEALAGTSGRR